MRGLHSLGLFGLVGLLGACNVHLDDGPEAPVSLREQLTTAVQLGLDAPSSAGVITAERLVNATWDGGAVELAIETGGFMVQASSDELTLEQLAVSFLPVEVPPAVFGHPARIDDVVVTLLHPLTGSATWTGDNDVTIRTTMELGLSWTIVIDGNEAPLGSPRLPPVPVELALTGDGTRIDARLRLDATGELWSWAGLVRLSDLALQLGAHEPATL